jgi:hypothetical protein
MSWVQTTFVILIIVIAIVIGLYYGLKDDNSSIEIDVSTSGTNRLIRGEMKMMSSNLSMNSMHVQDKNVFEGCSYPTLEEQQSLSIGQHARLCPNLPYNWSQKADQYKLTNISYNENNNHQYVFEERGENEYIVPLDNMTGTYYSSYLNFEPDVWSHGFTTATKKELQIMINNSGESVLISGSGPDQLASSYDRLQFDFDLKSAIVQKIYLRNIENVQNVHGDNLKGSFRISYDHIDHHFKIGNVDKTIRILLTSSQGNMGDKLLLNNTTGEFEWFDTATGQMTSTRTPNVLSLLSVNSAIVDAFNERRLGIPIELAVPTSSEVVDFSKLNENNIYVTFDMLVDKFISFENLDQLVSDSYLLANPSQLLKRFTYDIFGFKAQIIIS